METKRGRQNLLAVESVVALNRRPFIEAFVVSVFSPSTWCRGRCVSHSRSEQVATAEIFTKDDKSERLCAFYTATMRALDLPAEFQSP